MKNLDINKYGPIISDRETGKEIYDLIKSRLDVSEVIVDLSSIKSMATFCAKQIFGKLYVELGAQTFFDKVELKNASDDIKTIIKIGIQSALDEAKGDTNI
jgi:hypothetical protein